MKAIRYMTTATTVHDIIWIFVRSGVCRSSFAKSPATLSDWPSGGGALLIRPDVTYESVIPFEVAAVAIEKPMASMRLTGISLMDCRGPPFAKRSAINQQ